MAGMSDRQYARVLQGLRGDDQGDNAAIAVDRLTEACTLLRQTLRDVSARYERVIEQQCQRTNDQQIVIGALHRQVASLETIVATFAGPAWLTNEMARASHQLAHSEDISDAA